MELADILSEESVLVGTGIASKSQLIARIAEEAARLTGIDAAGIERTLTDREALGSTGLGNGIAIPHGKLSGLGGVVALFIRVDGGVDFDAVDDQKVDLVMALFAPAGFGADHLKALARVARLLRTESVVAALRAAPDARAIHTELTTAATARAA